MPAIPPRARHAGLLAGAVAFAFVTADRDLSFDFKLGQALAEFTVVLALVTLLMAWHRSTRARIPPVTLLGVIALYWLDSPGERDREVLQAEVAAMQSLLQDPWAERGVPGDSLQPAGSEAWTLRVTRKTLQDLAGWMRPLVAEYAAAPREAPGGWLSAAYLADAGRYPGVGRYFARCTTSTRRILREWEPRTDSVLRRHLADTYLSTRAAERVRRGFPKGARGSLASTGTLGRQEQWCRAAADLHAFLVSVDARVHLDPDGRTLRFADPAENREASALLAAVRARALLLEDARARQRRETDALADSLTDLVPREREDQGPSTGPERRT